MSMTFSTYGHAQHTWQAAYTTDSEQSYTKHPQETRSGPSRDLQRGQHWAAIWGSLTEEGQRLHGLAGGGGGKDFCPYERYV